MTTGGLSLGDSLQTSTIAAHELKAPLALVRQLALELAQTDLSEQQRSMLVEQIRLTSERALRLSTNLTKASNLQTELFPTMPVNVVELCYDLGRELQPLYQAHERSLSYRRPRRLPLARANHDLLRRIVTCFVDNALHYSDEQGTVELYTQLLRSRDVIRIGVRDYGPGLPSALWKKLAATERIPEAVRLRPDSSGLGLHIAHRFAEVNDAHIGAIRHRDGASFYVDVPLSKQLALL